MSFIKFKNDIERIEFSLKGSGVNYLVSNEDVEIATVDLDTGTYDLVEDYKGNYNVDKFDSRDEIISLLDEFVPLT